MGSPQIWKSEPNRKEMPMALPEKVRIGLEQVQKDLAEAIQEKSNADQEWFSWLDLEEFIVKILQD